MRRRLVAAIFRGVTNRSLGRIAGDGSLPLSGIHRILVCRPNHRLGNILLLTPLLAELERLYPGAEVDVVLGSPVGAELMSQFPRVRNIFNLTPRIVRHPIVLASVLRKIRAMRYDMAIDPTPNSMSGRMIMLAARAEYSVGIQPEAMAAAANDAPWNRHFAQLPVEALRRAISDKSNIDKEQRCPPLSIRLTPHEREVGYQILVALAKSTDTDRVIGVFANATGHKRYEEAWWMRLLERLLYLRPDLVVVEFIAAHGKSQLRCRYQTFYSTNARHLGAVISQLNCFISADCGVMHLAASSATTTIGLFSVTDPFKYQPYSGRSRSVMTVGRSPEGVADACVEIIDQGRKCCEPGAKPWERRRLDL